jgi:CheY-like chemotaxis protein
MQGQEVIRSLRSNPLIPPTYAVVLTAMSNQEIRDLNREAKRMSIDEFIPKPLTIDEVRRLVTKFKRQQSA